MRVAWVAVLLCAGCAAPSENGGPATEIPGLRTRVTLDLHVPLQGWLDALHKETGVEFRLDPRIAEFRTLSEPFRLALHDMSALSALQWILHERSCDYVLQDGVVVVCAPETAGTVSTVLRTYPIRAFPREFFSPRLPRIELTEESRVQVVASPKVDGEEHGPPDVESLIDLLKETVAPGMWEGVQTIEYDGQGSFVVNAPLKVHQDIRTFLDLLADTYPPSVTVGITLADAEGDASLRTIPADRVDDTLRGLRKHRPLEIEVTGPERHFVHSLVRRGTDEAALLVARAGLVDEGRSLQVDFQLSAGKTGLVTRIGTSILVPNGGAVLLAFPALDSKPQSCLVRAVSADRDPPRPRPLRFLRHPSNDPSGTEQRLANAPAAPLDLDHATLEEFAAWLRKTTGLTVFLPRSPGKQRLSLHADSIRPLQALTQLLPPLGLRFATRDEAIQINDSGLVRLPIRVAVLDARDAVAPPPDFDRRDLSSYFSEEDLGNLIKNDVHRDGWEEADGKTLTIHRGFFFIHNTESIIRECAAFIDGRRNSRTARVAFKAETIDLPVEELGGASAGFLIDAAQRDRLRAAGRRIDRREWTSFEGQKSCLEWERSRGATSFIEAQAVLRKDGRTFEVGLNLHDEGEPAVSTATTVGIPVGRTAIFRAAAGGRARILLLTPSLIP